MRERITHFNKLMVGVAVAVMIVFIIYSNAVNQTSIEMKDYIDFASKSISISALIGILYDKLLWKRDPFIKVPKLQRKYNGTMHSDYNGGMDIPGVEIAITQSYFHTSVKMKTGESWSRSIASTIYEEHDSFRLTYTYMNEPKADFANRSTMHYGTATFTIDDPKHITGNYYTDRKTIGSMDMNAIE